MRQAKLVQQSCEEHTPNPAVEVPEGMDPLKPPVSPCEQFGDPSDVALAEADMAQALGEVFTEQPHQAGNFIEVWWRMGPHRDVYVSALAGPVGEEATSQRSMALAEPVRADRQILGCCSDDFEKDTGEFDS